MIAPSVLAADFGRLADEVRAVEAAGADWLHLDVMDGHFVPNITIGPPIVAAIRKATSLPLDVHLMITEPERYVPAFVSEGADWISVHQETCADLAGAVAVIRRAGARASVAINPATAVAAVTEVLADIDMLLVMSVNPGFGGQGFIAESLAKLREAARLQSFPDGFKLSGSMNPRLKQIGNAVPPLLALAVATQLARDLEKSPSGVDGEGVRIDPAHDCWEVFQPKQRCG